MDCAHVYQLEAPNGRECEGRCLHCGDVKMHFNSNDRPRHWRMVNADQNAANAKSRET